MPDPTPKPFAHLADSFGRNLHGDRWEDTTEGGEFAAYADEARDWANVTLPTALEGWPDDTTTPVTECASCDICGAYPCRGGCWTGEFLGEERHRCVDEDACNAAFNAGPTAPVTADQPGRRYRLSLEFGAADDRQAHRLGMAWAGTCAAEYNTCNPVVMPVEAVTAEGMERRIAEVLTRDRSSGLCPLDGPCTSCDCFDPLHEYDRANAKAVMAEVVAPVLERFRKAVEDAPAVVAWTGACVECGEPFERRDSITWRLRWSPQGPIHEECR